MARLLLLSLAAGISAFSQTASTTALSANANPANISQTVALSAVVTPPAAGTVTFLDGFNILGTAVLNQSSVATLPYRFRTPRPYRLRAVYAGNATHAASTSQPFTLQIRHSMPTAFRDAANYNDPGLLADVNADGIEDSIRDSGVRLGNGDGTFGQPVDSQNTYAAVAADFNNDGNVDLVGGGGSLFYGAGNGSFTQGAQIHLPLLPGGWFPPGVGSHKVDLNRDGAADLIYGQLGFRTAPSVSSALFGNGRGGFSQQTSVPSGASVADFNGNSVADFFHISIISGVTIGAVVTYDLNLSSTGRSTDNPNGAIAGDVNGDGLDDMVTNESTQSGTGAIVLETSGLSSHSATVLANTRWTAVQILDWNNDGRVDLLVSEAVSSATTAVGYIPQQPNGSWGAVVPILTVPVGGRPSVTELSGDSYSDILVTWTSGASIFYAGAASGGVAPGFTAPVSVSPQAGSGASAAFTARYSASPDAGPADQRLTQVYLLINSVVSGTGGCFVEVMPFTNDLRVWSDVESRWLGPVKAGSAQSLSNENCTLAASGSSVSPPSTQNGVLYRDVTFAVQFKPAFAGERNTYLLSIASGGLNSGWKHAGSWTVTDAGAGNPTPPTGPAVLSLMPRAGSANTGTFTGTYSHSAGVNSIYLAYMLFLPTPNVVNFVAQGSCLVEYNRFSDGMRLIDDAGTGWHGGISGITRGVAGNTLSNSTCTVNVAGATVSFSGNNLVLSVPVTFAANFRRDLATFLQTQDVKGNWTGMTQFGNWTLPAGGAASSGPSVEEVAITSNGLTRTIALTAGGSATVLPSLVHIRIGPSILGAPVCHVVVAPHGDAVALINAEETALVGGGFIAMGNGAVLNNGRCSVNTSNVASFQPAPGRVRVTVPVSLGGMTGSNNVYLNVFDGQGNLTHWRTYGPVNLP